MTKLGISPAAAKQKQDKNFKANRILILQAHKQRKSTVKLGDRLFKIVVQNREPMVHVGGTSHKVKETWLIVSPADGSLVPCYSIDPGNKLRTALA